MLAQLKKHLTLHELWEDAKFFFLLNLGLVATAVGIAVFKTPNHFAFGGTSGLSIVLATLFPRWNVGAFMWFINAALVVLGFVFLGVRSMGWTIYSSFALSFYVSLCERVCPLSAPLTSDAFLELCFAVILSAVGAAIVFNIGASTGGTDIVAMILNKYTSMPVGRALMATPQLVMMDEPSLGLAPIVVRGIFDIIREINAQGNTVLLIEQNANMALKIADQAYVMQTGTITMSGTGRELAENEEVKAAYLGKAK